MSKSSHHDGLGLDTGSSGGACDPGAGGGGSGGGLGLVVALLCCLGALHGWTSCSGGLSGVMLSLLGGSSAGHGGRLAGVVLSLLGTGLGLVVLSGGLAVGWVGVLGLGLGLSRSNTSG